MSEQGERGLGPSFSEEELSNFRIHFEMTAEEQSFS